MPALPLVTPTLAEIITLGTAATAECRDSMLTLREVMVGILRITAAVNTAAVAAVATPTTPASIKDPFQR